MRSDARRRAIGHATPTRTFVRNREILDAARSDRSRPGQSVHRIWNIKASSGFTWEAIPHNRKPRFQTARMSRKYSEVLRVSTARSEPRGPSRYPVVRPPPARLTGAPRGSRNLGPAQGDRPC
jgi:hypothetical protein